MRLLNRILFLYYKYFTDEKWYFVEDLEYIYEGAPVVINEYTNYVRDVGKGGKFVGFADIASDNSCSSGNIVRVIERGKILLSITGVKITDVGQPVYAVDNGFFTFLSKGYTFVGFVHRLNDLGEAVVKFDVDYEMPS